MPFIKNKGFITTVSLGFFLALTGLPTGSLAVPLEIADFYQTPRVPKQKITVTGTAPSWLDLWQEARRLYYEEDYVSSREKYELLLESKRDMAQARRELVSVLLFLNDFESAANQLERLLEDEPDRVEYLSSLGYVMYVTDHFVRSAELFQLALCGDPENRLSQAGLSLALLKTDRQDLALPYLEKLSISLQENVALQYYLVSAYIKNGMADKARPLVVQLAGGENPPLAALKLAAEVHESLGLDNLAADYHQKILAIKMEDEPSHAWLASYYEKEGRCDEALHHLHVLLQKNDKQAGLLLRTGRCYQKINQTASAVEYLEKYLSITPDDKDIIRQLVNLHAALGHGEDTIAALDRYFQVEADPTPGNLKQAARIYDAAGRYSDAIPIYRRLLQLTPDDPEVLAVLAQDLLSIGADEGALQIWNKLARLSPGNKETYRSLADLLIKLDRQNELLDVLPKLHKLDPGDDRVTLQLASALFAVGEDARGEGVFQIVAKKEIFSADSLFLRAKIFEYLQMRQHALRDYEDILRSRPGGIDLQIKCLQLSGSLGMLDRALRHFEALPLDWLDTKRLLIIANAFRDGNDYGRAETLYQQIINDPSRSRVVRWQAHVEQAASYEQQGLYFEAEQSLRSALLIGSDNVAVLSRLVMLLLKAGEYDEAGVWLTQLLHLSGADDEGLIQCQGLLLEVKLFNTTERFSAALRKGRVLLGMLESDSNNKNSIELRDLKRHLLYELGKARLGREEFDKAERLAQQLLARKSFDLRALVFLQMIYKQQGDDRAARALKQTMAVAGKDIGRMLDLARLYQDEGFVREMAGATLQATRMVPGSLNASILHAEALSLLGDLSQARDVLNTLQRSLPASSVLESMAAHITFHLGLYQEAQGYCDSILSRQPQRADIYLLKGRIYWSKLDWKESLEVYERYLTPGVDNILASKLKGAGIYVSGDENRSFLHNLFAKSDEQTFVDKVMSPSYVIASKNEETSMLAVPLYSRYKWETRIAEEQAARQSVQKGDYFQAADLFSELVETYPGDKSLLFDLAGIYSRQGRLAEEALLYSHIARVEPEYPGLVEAAERNRLKRRPNLRVSYHYLQEEGWNGYKALESNFVDLAFGTSLKPGGDVNALVSRVKYSSTKNSDSLMSKRSFVEYEMNVGQGVNVRVGGGVENLEEGYSDTGLVQCEVKGKIGDRVRGEVSYSRDVVSDTLASLTRNIVADNVQAGIILGIMPRLLTGGGYGYTDYSDKNDVRSYSFWASYTLFTEPTFLQLKGKYEFKDATDGSSGTGPILDDGFREDDHPYWTPRNYWRNTVGLLWKHKLSADTLDRGKPSYYTAEFLMGYDSYGHAIQTIKGGFFVEWTKNFMLESSVEFVDSNEYRSRNITLSAVYRW